jgi:hypothetical protein
MKNLRQLSASGGLGGSALLPTAFRWLCSEATVTAFANKFQQPAPSSSILLCLQSESWLYESRLLQRIVFKLN